MADTGIRNTKQKQAIYEALCALDHPSATEVYDRLHTEYPTISRGTVFRVLGGFAESGKVRKLQLSDSDDRYDPTLAPHYHARCRVCGRVEDVFLPEADALLGAIKETEHFTINGYDVEFFGACKDCRNQGGET